MTTDGTIIEAPVYLMQQSVLIKGLIDDGGVDEEIPLPEVSEHTVRLIITFLEHLHENNPPDIEKPLRSNNLEDVTTEWYANFINLDDEKVQDLIIAANYMDIKPLLDLACAKLGSIIRNLSIPDFRKRFNIVNDFTPEEENEPFDEARIAELAEEYEK